MEETASYSINSQAVFISEEQFRALSLNPSCGYVSVSSEPSQLGSNLIKAKEKNVSSSSEPNMQTAVILQPHPQVETEQNTCPIYNIFYCDCHTFSIKLKLPQSACISIIVNNSSIIGPDSISNTDVTAADTSGKTTYATILIGRDLRSCQIQFTNCGNSQTPISKPEDLALQLKIYIEPRYFYNVLIPRSLINEESTTNENLNRIVQSALTHLYKVHFDLQSAVMDDERFYNLIREPSPLALTDEEEDIKVAIKVEMGVEETVESTIPVKAVKDITIKQEIENIPDKVLTIKQEVESIPDDVITIKQEVESIPDEVITIKQEVESIPDDDREEGEVVEEEVVEEEIIQEETITMDVMNDVISGNNTAPPSVMVCSNCDYSSPDSSICPRCRRNMTLKRLDKKTDREHHSRDSKRRSIGRKCKRKERKIKEDEIQCLSLVSSDEDEKVPAYRVPVTDVFSKEPIITEDSSESESYPSEPFKGGGLEVEKLLDSRDIERICLDCRSVRFGSYKVKPLDTIVLTEHGVKLKVPSLTKTSTIIKILMKDIVKVLIHFGKCQLSSTADPTFFYYLSFEASKKIREALNMSPKNKDLFFDPTSKEEQHKRITLLPENVTSNDRLFIKSIYEARCLMEELSWAEANDILVRAAPKDVQHNLKKDVPPQVKHLPLPANNTEGIQQIMIYPPQPSKGGISINTEDYGCLRADQFLNDVIIDFYLKYLWLNEFTEEQKKCTHIFSSFFYKRLTMMPPKLNYNQKDNFSPAEKRHARVKGWTKSVDIFSKDFIIIPINEKSHWFLGIICFPGLNGPVRFSDGTPIPRDGGDLPAKIYGTTISIVKAKSTERPPAQRATPNFPHDVDDDRGDESERDEAEADENEMEPDTTDEEANKEENPDLLDEATPRVSKVKPSLEAIKQPCILIFDSLAIQSRAKVVATLREYLQVEWKIRHKGKPKDFSTHVFKGNVPKVPQQPNFVDCGLYLLQFVEAFFKNPITDYRMPIRSIKDWFTNDVVSRKRQNIMKLLHDIMRDQNIDTSLLNLPNLELTSYVSEFEEEDEPIEEEAENMDYEDEAVEEEEEMMGEDDEEDEDGDEPYHPIVQHTPQMKSKQQKMFEQHSVPPPLRAVEIGRGMVEVSTPTIRREVSRREVEMSRREVEVSRREVELSRSETPSSGPTSSGRRFDSPSPRLEPRSDPPPPLRPRLPDTVTICEANSKRKLPLSLKDIRNTRLASNHATIEKARRTDDAKASKGSSPFY